MYCNKCGREIPNDSKNCKYCGTAIINRDMNKTKTKNKFYKEWWFWLIIVFGGLVAIGLGSDFETENAIKSHNNINNSLIDTIYDESINNKVNESNEKVILDNEKTTKVNTSEDKSKIETRGNTNEYKRKKDTNTKTIEDKSKIESKKANNITTTEKVDYNKYSNSRKESSKAIEANSTSTKKTQIVWVGKTGDKYHRESCSTLRGKGYSINLKEALAQGREPCKRCKP